MTRSETPVNMAHSVHDRLLSLARQRGRPFNEILQYFAMERFLYRLSKSPAGKQFVLKGALLLTAYSEAPYRPTRDIDLLGRGENTEARMRELMQSACRQAVPDDGLSFDPASVGTERIKKDADYVGVRVQFSGNLGNARLDMQVDIGFGDAITPAPRMISYPALLDFPPPHLRAYPIETVIAEKLHAIIYLGELNSRMKDFYDIWVLRHHADVDLVRLEDAVRATFKRRGMPLDVQPACFVVGFAAAKQPAWKAFLRKLQITDVPEDLAIVISDIQSFTLPLLMKLRGK